MHFPGTYSICCATLLLLLAAARCGASVYRVASAPGDRRNRRRVVAGADAVGLAAHRAVGVWLFPKSGQCPAGLAIVSQIGLVLLMYASGSQLRSFVAAGEKKVVAALSLAGTLLPLLAGLVYVRFVDICGELIGHGPEFDGLRAGVCHGDRHRQHPGDFADHARPGHHGTSFARIVIATAVIDDLVLYLILAVALGLVSAGGSSHGLASLLGLDPASHWAALVHVVATIAVIAARCLADPGDGGDAATRAESLSWDRSAAAHLVCLVLVSGGCLLLDVNPMFGGLAAGLVAGRIGSPIRQRPCPSRWKWRG